MLRAYEQVSDASAILALLFDQRWQMILGCLATEQTIILQGTLWDFRHRLIKHNLHVSLLEQPIEIAKKVLGYKQLRIALLDSVPLKRADRIEDVLNLVGDALKPAPFNRIGITASESQPMQTFKTTHDPIHQTEQE